MATPQMPGTLKRTLERMAYDIRLLQQRSPYLGTGLSAPAANTTQVDGSLIVQNGEAKSGNFAAGSAGWHLDHSGNAEFNDLTLRGGIVGNAALTNPVVPQVVLQQATNYSVAAGSLNTIVSQSVTVPANCTQLLAHSLVFSFVVNPNTTGGSNGSGGDVHELKAYIGGSGGQTTGVSISGNNGQTSVSAGAAVLLTGLTPGATVTLEARAGNGYQAFAANGSNVASITATLMWLR